MPPRTLHIAAACLFDETGRLLLVRKRDTRMFMLPGGKRDEGETPLQTLVRELHEELDLHLPETAFTPLGHFSEVAANEADTRVEADIFRALLPHPVLPAAELEELRWLRAFDSRTDDLAPLLRRHVLPLIWPSA
ncbi:NUDIX hydrolase [Pseudomonas daroniae]|uniref:NUDIX hydrolase n=1 Tax=Phytopseudomonas daroniae TaxID=2487519 RepID=A0A4Q9QS67_9GAMM|nr:MULTISPECIES: NUDIX domain-containing protein [Pseudomonas]TBU83281.1 NUDIX hydrolase [Pseudomonas daroniae]TBU84920.1 NUDIX hydrolase [Pseudomonas sp. FRB 228]TBU93787.1 NUDIX hydrolase [Pseudomonas daroniae]